MKKSRGRISINIQRINFHYVALIIMILLLSVGMSIYSPYFLTATNMQTLVNTFIMEAIMALGMTLVIISGGIDLTIASILPFSSIILVIIMSSGIPFPAAAVIVLAAAACIGMITNLLRKTLNLHPMIVTMAIAAVIKGVNLTVTGGSAISDVPESFAALSKARILGMPVSWVVYIVLAVLFLYFSKNSRTFTNVYFVGGNENAAALSGIKIQKVYRNVYVISAVLAAVAGILTAMTYSSASYSYGTNADTRVIVAVAIGGTSLTHGGEGSIEGTLLGSLFMAIIYNVFVLSGISTYYQDVVTGVFLIAAILLSEGIIGNKLRPIGQVGINLPVHKSRFQSGL